MKLNTIEFITTDKFYDKLQFRKGVVSETNFIMLAYNAILNKLLVLGSTTCWSRASLAATIFNGCDGRRHF